MRSVALSSPKPGDARGFKLCPRSTIRAVMYIRGKVVKGSGLIFIIDRGDANVPTPTSPVPNIQGIHNWANWISWWDGGDTWRRRASRALPTTRASACATKSSSSSNDDTDSEEDAESELVRTDSMCFCTSRCKRHTIFMLISINIDIRTDTNLALSINVDNVMSVNIDMSLFIDKFQICR